jgi:hypothetical protein
MEASLGQIWRNERGNRSFVREVYAAGGEMFRYILEVQAFCCESKAALGKPL